MPSQPQSQSHSSKFDIPLLASYYIQGPITPSSITPQIELRARIISSWNIPRGSQILEIGCGQGDATIVLADAVGEEGHVDAVDPGSPDYGSPITLSQSQSHLSKSPLGNRITFINTDPITHLSATTKSYTHVILFHSLWYFSSPAQITSLLTHLLASCRRIHTLCIAEYALQAHTLNAVPHVLAALAQSSLGACGVRDQEQSNICSAVSPAWIKRSLRELGLGIEREDAFRPSRELAEGRWEVQEVLSEGFGKRIREAAAGDEGLEIALGGMRDAVKASLEVLEGGVRGVETMSVWTGVVRLTD